MTHEEFIFQALVNGHPLQYKFMHIDKNRLDGFSRWEKLNCVMDHSTPIQKPMDLTYLFVYPREILNYIKACNPQLQKYLIISGDMNKICFNNINAEFTLPNDLIVGGSLDLSGTNISKLPRNLIVYGELNISNTKIKSIANCTFVSGSVISNGIS